VSAKTVSNSLEVLRESANKWLDRPLHKRYWALYIDGTNFRIQRRGSTEKEPLLVVLGIGEDDCERENIYSSLWVEGLAVLAADALNPNATKAETFQKRS